MDRIEITNKSNTKLYCPLCGTLLQDDGPFKECDHVIYLATDEGGFSYVKDGSKIDPEPDFGELNIDEYTDALEIVGAFKIALYTPAPSGFGVYIGFQQNK
jgi:hypothetical protein